MSELKKLSDQNLLLKINTLVKEERKLLLEILHYLREVERRKVFADLGYDSLFKYCVWGLGYSEGQAQRRINAMRMMRDLPEVEKKIEEGRVNLSQLSLLQGFFKEKEIVREEKLQLIEQVEKKSLDDTRRMLNNETLRQLKFKVKSEIYESWRKLRGISAHQYKTDEELLHSLIVEKLQKKNLSQTKHRNTAMKVSNSRYIPKIVKMKVWEKANGHCEKCDSTYGLQIDHISPLSRGGLTESSNLQLLCWGHHQRKSIQE